MSVPLGLLKHIPCPNGDACTTASCLFGHASEKDTRLAPAGGNPPPPTPSSAGARDASSHGHRRTTGRLGSEASHKGGNADRSRAKLAEAAYDSTATAPTARGRGDSATGGKDAAVPPKAVRRPSSPKPISPPPLKRRRVDAGGGAAAQRTPAKDAGAAAPQKPSAPQKMATPQKPAAAAAAAAAGPGPGPAKRKAEALNPRYLVKAPAKHEVRLRLLTLLHQEYARLNKALAAAAAQDRPDDRKQLCLTEQGLIWAALDTEEHFATTKTAAVYADTLKHRIMDCRRMTVDRWVQERRAAQEQRRRQQQQQQQQQQKQPAAGSGGSLSKAKALPPAAPPPPPPPPPIVTGLPPDQELVLLQRDLLTPIDGLAEHGYVAAVPSEADIQRARDAEDVSKGWEQCARCSRRFQVFPGRREEDGALTSGGACQYHPGRLNRSTKAYDCCGESVDQPSPQRLAAPGLASSGSGSQALGCEVAASHVFKTKDPKRMAALWNFAPTPDNPRVPADRAVCFDCEMAYTVHGMEVVRLTVTAWPGGERLLDVLVRPFGAIIDLNSRFSGVWPQDLANAVPYAEAGGKNPTAESQEGPDGPAGADGADGADHRPRLPLVASPEEARRLFHALIRPETVLIGHALENDLNVMRMVHPRLVDTVLLFPHPRGLPYRYSLRVLAKEHMERTIQTGLLSGHDSAEDARTAGDLVRARIRTRWADLRLQNWTLVDGQMVLARR